MLFPSLKQLGCTASNLVFWFAGQDSADASRSLEAVGVAVRGGVGLDHLEEGDGGVRERRLPAVDEAEHALDLEFLDGDADQGAGRDLVLHREAGDEGDPVAHLNEPFDGVERGEFNRHIQRSAMPAEGLDHLLALG